MKPKVGIFGLSGCWGEQIVILNCEDQLLHLVGAVEIVDFLGGSSVNDEKCPLNIALVEGSVATAREEDALRRIRERAELLIACGSCACFGGIAAMDAGRSRQEIADMVYGRDSKNYDLRPHRPLGNVVKVDFAIPGCPMEKEDFLHAVASLLNGDLPVLPAYPVCTECKMKEQDCLLLSRGLPCVGPVTAAGCGARCPSFNVACIGCRGPADEANFDSLKEVLVSRKFSEENLRRMLHNFAAPAQEKVKQGGLA